MFFTSKQGIFVIVKTSNFADGDYSSAVSGSNLDGTKRFQVPFAFGFAERKSGMRIAKEQIPMAKDLSFAEGCPA